MNCSSTNPVAHLLNARSRSNKVLSRSKSTPFTGSGDGFISADILLLSPFLLKEKHIDTERKEHWIRELIVLAAVSCVISTDHLRRHVDAAIFWKQTLPGAVAV